MICSILVFIDAQALGEELFSPGRASRQTRGPERTAQLHGPTFLDCLKLPRGLAHQDPATAFRRFDMIRKIVQAGRAAHQADRLHDISAASQRAAPIDPRSCQSMP
jgi:hypothetical protein